MPQVSNTGAPLTSEEEVEIYRAFKDLKLFVAGLSDDLLTPVELTKIVFEIAGRCYHVKDTIDRAFKTANVRAWRGTNVSPFKRGVSPLPQAPDLKAKRQAELLESVGIHTLEDLNRALAQMGLPPKEPA
jgi:hypothetical protein